MLHPRQLCVGLIPLPGQVQALALTCSIIIFKGTYYENNTFPGIWGVFLGLWCSHRHRKIRKKSVHHLFEWGMHFWRTPPTFTKRANHFPTPLQSEHRFLGWEAPAGGTWRQTGSSALGVQTPSLPDCRRAPPAGAAEQSGGGDTEEKGIVFPELNCKMFTHYKSLLVLEVPETSAQPLWFIISSEAHIAFGRDIRYYQGRLILMG